MLTHKPPTIRGVAEEAGVSYSTANLVLNQRGGELRIRSETQQRVINAARRLNYAPHAGARMLRRGRSQTIALVAREEEYGFANGVFSKLFTAANQHCQQRDYNLIINQVPVTGRRSAGSEFDILDVPKPIREQAADAVMLVAVTLGSFRDTVQRCLGDRPSVQIMGSDEIDVPNLVFDASRTGAMAADYLHQRGHRHVAQLCGPELSAIANLVSSGFARRWGELSGQYPITVLPSGDYTVEAGRKLGEELFSRSRKGELTAVLAGNDMQAFGLMQAAAKRGWRVPDELAVMGMDNVVAADWCIPRLTTIAQPYEHMAKTAVDYLMAKLGDDQAPVPETTLVGQVIERDSCPRRDQMSI